MASIKKRPSGPWRARYRGDAGKEHARHFSRRIDAQRWLDGQTASIVTGQYVDPKAGRMTVCEYAATWLRSQVGRTRMLENADTALRVHILPRLGDLPLASVTRSGIGMAVHRRGRTALGLQRLVESLAGSEDRPAHP
jgi:hypothetical protein